MIFLVHKALSAKPLWQATAAKVPISTVPCRVESNTDASWFSADTHRLNPFTAKGLRARWTGKEMYFSP